MTEMKVQTGVAPYLRIERLTKQFGAFAALKDISLEIFPGEFICFLGPSGCGKTTLLRAIAGLDIQTSGRIFQGDKEISTLPASRRDFGIVFQSYALFPNLTVAANVGYGLVSRGMAKVEIRTRVDDLLRLVGLPEAGRKYPAQLSGGQQQRVAVARALALSPGLLLLDEPLSALDARVRAHLRSEIRRLHQRLKVTTIMVTHDQEEALTMADRIVVMNQGAIEQVGTPTEVYRKPASAFRFCRDHQFPARRRRRCAARALFRHRSRLRARHPPGRGPRRHSRDPARGRRRAQHFGVHAQHLHGSNRRDGVPRIVLPCGTRDQRRRSRSGCRFLDQHRARSVDRSREADAGGPAA
jgi:ABC-type proline/glycine betaine transport system ATPase subunit